MTQFLLLPCMCLKNVLQIFVVTCHLCMQVSKLHSVYHVFMILYYIGCYLISLIHHFLLVNFSFWGVFIVILIEDFKQISSSILGECLYCYKSMKIN